MLYYSAIGTCDVTPKSCNLKHNIISAISTVLAASHNATAQLKVNKNNSSRRFTSFFDNILQPLKPLTISDPNKMSRDPKIDTSAFYSEWSGHPLAFLRTFCDAAHTIRPSKPVIYLAGDSSLDNKAWIDSKATPPVPVPEIYSQTFATTSNPAPKHDIAFWLNHYLGLRATCINTAIEATLLRERDHKLLPHDEFIRDSISSNDVLIVSVGGNDIALSPTSETMMHMAQIPTLVASASSNPGALASNPSLQYFQHLFKDKVENYISRLVSKQKPRAVIVCMIYYPLEANTASKMGKAATAIASLVSSKSSSATSQQSSWADTQLRMLGYDDHPEVLQSAIRLVYEHATKQIRVEGTQVIPCALFEVLDGKRSGEYTARVEPNGEGGRKMAERFAEMLKGVV